VRNASAAVALLLFLAGCASPVEVPAQQPASLETIELPQPRVVGSVSVEEALLDRRSVRQYSVEPLSLDEVSQLLWAAQGMTAEWGGRTAPSAGALYPLELYVVAARVEDLDQGVYRYLAQGHRLIEVRDGDVGQELTSASLDQSSVRDAAAVLVFSAVYERTTSRYGDRGVKYVHMEVGHAAQNVCLQATALGLGCVVIGAFSDDGLREVLRLSAEETPLYVLPLGRIAAGS